MRVVWFRVVFRTDVGLPAFIEFEKRRSGVKWPLECGKCSPRGSAV